MAKIPYTMVANEEKLSALNSNVNTAAGEDGVDLRPRFVFQFLQLSYAEGWRPDFQLFMLVGVPDLCFGRSLATLATSLRLLRLETGHSQPEFWRV
jgi:hypothetical protein